MPWIPGAPAAVVICDTETARELYKASDMIKPPFLYSAIARFSSGDNLLNLHGGPNWFHRRKGINPAFAPKQIKVMNQIALQVAQAWEESKLLPKNNGDVTTFDVGKEMVDITVSVICQSALNYETTREKREWLLKELTTAWVEFTMKDAFNPLRRFGTWVLPERQRAFGATQNLKQFAMDVIEAYRKNPIETQSVIALIINNPNYKNDEERASDIVMILFAGHDTTGYTLAITLHLLAKHPKEQENLRKQLATKGYDTDPATNSYLKHVISETMRLYPVVSITAIRSLGRDFTTNHGQYYIPKGSIIFIGQNVIARDPKTFENPLQFQPSRWLHATEEMKQSLFPFALGNRNCVGQPLAYAELYTIVPYLIQRYEFSIVDEGDIKLVGATLRLDKCTLAARKLQ